MFSIFLMIATIATFAKVRLSHVCDLGYVSNGTSCEECGLSEFHINARIVNGKDAVPYSWPSHVLIKQFVKAEYTFDDGNTYLISLNFQCGGTLINHQTILTAGHCIYREFTYDFEGKTYTIPVEPNEYFKTWESMFVVYLGAHDIENNLPDINSTISKIIIHPSFSENYQINQLNDLCLLILSNPVTYTRFIKPACLPYSVDYDYPQANTDSYAVGWGKLSEYQPAANKLQNVKIKIYEPAKCRNVYPEKQKNWKSQICAGNYSGGQDTCLGDSGGGLYIIDNSTSVPRRIVVGITSFGAGCGRPMYPGIYTRVSFYIDFIRLVLFNLNII